MYLTDSISLHSTVSKLSVPQTPNPIEESNQVTARGNLSARLLQLYRQEETSRSPDDTAVTL